MRLLLWTLGIAAAGAALWFAVLDEVVLGDSDQGAVSGAAVRRGPLRVSVTERGNLKAARSVEIKSELEGRNVILWLIEEGSQVEPGDLLCELDATALIEERTTQEISVQNAEGDYVKAKQNLEIQESQNESDIAAGERALEFARKDLAKYLEGDWPQQKQGAEEEIALKEEELKRAEDQLKWSLELFEQKFYTQTELEADELAKKRSEIQLEQAKRTLALLEEYEYPREVRRLEADLVEAERELKRVRLQAEARLIDYNAGVRTSKARFDIEQEQLAKLEDQIGKARLTAPVAGMVVYAMEDGGRGRDDAPIAEGAEVRERENIITIPAADGMVVQASLHESVLQQVEVGQPVVVRVDALPGREFAGRVRFKAMLPDQNSWWANPNLRLYRSEVELVEVVPQMRPGMSCSVEIVVADLADAVHVPYQSVFVDEGRTIAFVKNAEGRFEPRPIDIGQHNETWVEVTGGLEAGQVVALSQPPGYRLRSAAEAEADAAPVDDEPPPAGPADGRDALPGASSAGEDLGGSGPGGARPASAPAGRGGADVGRSG